MTPEVRKQIEKGVKEIAKKSTAPDKETPDWMETDIRRGAEFGYQLASKALSDANKEIERLRKMIETKDFRDYYEDQLTQDKKECMKWKIYIASKTKHADKWLKLRESGVNIISTWIDEAGQGKSKDLNDLCLRCIRESKECDAMIVYAEPGDYLKGAFIEMGVALSVYLKPIYLVGEVLPIGSAFTYSHQVFSAKTVEEAIELINTKHYKSSHPEQGEQGEVYKELAVDFAFENTLDKTKGYQHFRQEFDSWLKENNYWQQKLSSPPPEGQDERIKELENFLRTIRTGDLETIRKEASCLLIKK